MPNLQGASPVGRDGGGRSYAAQMGSSGRPRRRRCDHGGALCPVKIKIGWRKMRAGRTNLQAACEKGDGPAGRRIPARRLAANASRRKQQSEMGRIERDQLTGERQEPRKRRTGLMNSEQ